MAYGMTPQGFVPKRTAEILSDMNDGIAAIVDPATGSRAFRNPTDDTLLQQIIGVFAEQLAMCWNAAAEGAIQFDPLKNTGAGQSGAVQLNGILRKSGSRTVITLAASGEAGTVIPQGSRAATYDKLHEFITTAEATVPESGVAAITARAAEKGPFVPDVNTVTYMMTPVPGWRSVTNTGTAAAGTAEETDRELRIRQQRSTALPATSVIESIYAAVMNVPGVIWARAYQNVNLDTDDRGIPGKEVAVVAVGGEDSDIASVLRSRFPVGVTGYGGTSDTWTDAQGFEHTISFSRPEPVPVTVHVTLSVTAPGILPPDAASLIKQYILDYARYGGEGNDVGFPPGTGVVRTRLFTPINKVPGHEIAALQIGTGGSAAAQDVPIAWNQVAEWDEDAIFITINQ